MSVSQTGSETFSNISSPYSTVRSLDSDLSAFDSHPTASDSEMRNSDRNQAPAAEPSEFTPLLDSDGSSRRLSEKVQSADTPTRSKFYMDGEETLILMVENTEYKLHTYFFNRDSEPFRSLIHKRFDPSSVLRLLDTSALDFDRFLNVLYPTDFRRPAASTTEEWMSILRVAHRWEFHSIRELALERLAPIASPVDKIVCARTLGGPADWIVPSHAAICARDEALTGEEGRRLGMDEVLCIYDAWREITKLSAPLPEDVSVVIEDKLQLHGLFPCQGRDTHEASTPSTSTDPATAESPSVDHVGVHIPITSIDHSVDAPTTLPEPDFVPLDIRNGSNESIIGCQDGDFELGLASGRLVLNRRADKLAIVVGDGTEDSVSLYINGRQCVASGKYALYHGDAICFSKSFVMVNHDKTIVFAGGTGYMVCKTSIPLGAAGMSLGQLFHPYAQKNLQKAQDDLAHLDERLYQLKRDAIAYEFCLTAGVSRHQDHVAELKAQIEDIAEGIRQNVVRLVQAARIGCVNPRDKRKTMSVRQPLSAGGQD